MVLTKKYCSSSAVGSTCKKNSTEVQTYIPQLIILTDIPITNNGSEIFADTDSRSDIQQIFYLSVHNFTILWPIFP